MIHQGMIIAEGSIKINVFEPSEYCILADFIFEYYGTWESFCKDRGIGAEDAEWMFKKLETMAEGRP